MFCLTELGIEKESKIIVYSQAIAFNHEHFTKNDSALDNFVKLRISLINLFECELFMPNVPSFNYSGALIFWVYYEGKALTIFQNL